MKLIDTHAHLQFEKFEIDRKDVIKRSSEKLYAVINPGADLTSSEAAVRLASQVSNFFAAVGVHPHHVDNWTENYLSTLLDLVTQPKVVAVGEIGLDQHVYQGYSEPDIEKQKTILLPQIELALAHKKPILFHCRHAYDHLYQTIKKYRPIKGLLHCFMGNKNVAKKFADLGLLISFAGNLTYKSNDQMRDAVSFLANDQIVIETDSPFLAPEPLRGQRNEPLNVKIVAETISQIKNVSIDQVANFTTENARKLFTI